MCSKNTLNTLYIATASPSPTLTKNLINLLHIQNEALKNQMCRCNNHSNCKEDLLNFVSKLPLWISACKG